MKPARYAVYYSPEPTEAWADLCTRWLGWDIATGERVDHPTVAGIADPISALTAVPRRYGFHATIKPPFRLLPGKKPEALERAVRDLASDLSPVTLQGLTVTRLGRFLALTPQGDTSDLDALAAKVVRHIDGFRAPPTEQEMEKRRAAKLTPSQSDNLNRWGYPYVMADFRFHMTLTGRLPKDDLGMVHDAVSNWLGPTLPKPFTIGHLSLVGEDADGFFHLLERYPLGTNS